LALGGGIFLARTLTRPIESLRRAFEAVAAGELGIQVPGQPKGELGQLTDGFNRMSRDLQRSHEQLVRATRLAAWQDVARRLAHEIKNPLTPIQLSAQRLRRKLEGSLPDPESREVLHRCTDSIASSVDAMKHLLLEFQRLSVKQQRRLRLFFRHGRQAALAALVRTGRCARPGVSSKEMMRYAAIYPRSPSGVDPLRAGLRSAAGCP